MSNDILLSGEVEKKLRETVPLCQNDLNVISGFCKVKTLEFIDSLVVNSSIRKRLLVRFLPTDLASGSTDKELFSYCETHGWDFYIDYTIHAKTYIFDKIKCIMGSSNLTNRGIGLSEDSNKEASVCFGIDDDDYRKIMSLYKDALKMDRELFDFIIQQSDDSIVVERVNKKSLDNDIRVLFPEDFPQSNSDLIDLYSSRSFKWLVAYLGTKQLHESYFGELSAEIHSIFVKEPRPYRRDIKTYLANLISCIKANSECGLDVVRPNYSEIVRLADKMKVK